MYRFRPWIGENYQQSRWGKRVLVLGESHYQYDKNLPIDNYPDLTIDCVKEQIDGQYTYAFWTRIAVAFLNPPSSSPSQFRREKSVLVFSSFL